VCAHIEAVSCYHNNKKTLTTQRVVQVVWSGNLKLKKKIEILTTQRVVQVDLNGKTWGGKYKKNRKFLQPGVWYRWT